MNLVNRSAEIQRAIDELKVLIIDQYPRTSFFEFEGADPVGVYLQATVDVEDTDEVVDLVIDRLIEIQVHQALPVYVVPVRPSDRVLAESKSATQAALRPFSLL